MATYIPRRNDKVEQIFLRSNKSYRFVIRRGDTVVKEYTKNNQSKLSALRDQIRDNIRDASEQNLKDPASLNIGNILDMWIEHVKSGTSRHSQPMKTDMHGTYYLPVSGLRRCTNAMKFVHQAYCVEFEDHKIDDCEVTIQDIIDMGKQPLQKLFQNWNVSTSTRKERAQKINQIFNWLQSEQWFETKDLLEIVDLNNPTKIPYKRKNLSHNDIDKFMTQMAIAEYPLRHFVQFSMEVGTRPNELFGLTHDDFSTTDVDGRTYQTIIIRRRLQKLHKNDGNYYMLAMGTKTSKQNFDAAGDTMADAGVREIPLTPTASEALQNHQQLENALREEFADHYAKWEQKYIDLYGIDSFTTCANKLVFTRLPMQEGQSFRVPTKNLYSSTTRTPKGDYPGWPLDSKMLTKDFKWFGEKAGITVNEHEIFGYRNVRNIMITKKLEKMSIDQVKQFAGHRHATTTQEYVTRNVTSEPDTLQFLES